MYSAIGSLSHRRRRTDSNAGLTRALARATVWAKFNSFFTVRYIQNQMSSDYLKIFMLLCNVQIKVLFVKAYIIPAKALYFNPHVQRSLEFWGRRLIKKCIFKLAVPLREKHNFLKSDFHHETWYLFSSV